MNFPRAQLKPLLARVATPDIVVLTGMRRTGKTTLLRMVFDTIPSANKVFLDLENPLDQMIFEERDYNNIWANLRTYGVTPARRPYVFLDEIQAYPPVVQALKYLHDHYHAKFFVTGSSSFYLKNLFPESLAGRKTVFDLHPLDFREFIAFKRCNREWHDTFAAMNTGKGIVRHETVVKLYDEYVEHGGFPQVVLAGTDDEKRLQLRDIFKSYFEKEVRSLAGFRDISAFRDLLLLLLRRVGAKLDISKLASEVGVARETVYSYLAFLEGTFFIHRVSPFSRSVEREVSGARKIYLCDTGMVNCIARVDEGAIFENAVFLSIRRHGDVRYYERRSGGEIDFVLPGKNTAIEVKRTADERDWRKLSSLATDLKLRHRFIVTRTFCHLGGTFPATEL